MCTNNSNCCPRSARNAFIGDFALTNCGCYAEYEALSHLREGNEVHIRLHHSCDIIEVLQCDNRVIGELQVSDADKKYLLPYLSVGVTDIYDCRISQYSENARINERYRVSIRVVRR